MEASSNRPRTLCREEVRSRTTTELPLEGKMVTSCAGFERPLGNAWEWKCWVEEALEAFSAIRGTGQLRALSTFLLLLLPNFNLNSGFSPAESLLASHIPASSFRPASLHTDRLILTFASSRFLSPALACPAASPSSLPYVLLSRAKLNFANLTELN